MSAGDLEALAGAADALGGGVGESDAPGPQQGPADGLPPGFADAMAKIPAGLLRAIRSRIAQKLPTIVEEWPDAMLDGAAATVPPVVIRYMGAMGPWFAQYPEIAVMFFAFMPLGLGYIAASERHEANAARTVDAVVREVAGEAGG